ncbi:hypothetical protein GOP47_0012008 [Adiantum capillus-veneris]|uniref:RIN4 pathogenic type III effector avirulence factor Avr cleavage site domain-containing protein n=1 Tax=Adiantum capillus-veneris TaxID=13818 RepID=A0A9D4UTF3_ADICA|nr:hypothetical protein GOP47_0011557 [Adiantum capillus-veneris]KAI5073995.1 hypothetical protein GOP47_0012008 [Adiantum capillus-veneris]
MGHRPAHVPQFGNWDANEHVPFTAVFDNARAGKGGGKKFNPNDPEENPAAFGLKTEDGSQLEEFDAALPVPSKPPPAMETGPLIRNRGDGHGYSKAGDADTSRKGPNTSGAKENAGGADGSRRGPSTVGSRESAGPEESPNHQMYQGRLGNRPGSPYSERKTSSDGGSAHAPSAPGKSRLRGSSRADETPDRSAALPKFGAWDENDPSAGEGFTIIFNQARNEKKQGGPVRIPPLQGESPANQNYGDGYRRFQGGQHHQKKSSFWSCCLGSSSTHD